MQIENLFEKIHRTLKKHGIILVTMGTGDLELDINDFIGSTMAWSSYSLEENKKLVEEAGFVFLLVEEEHEQDPPQGTALRRGLPDEDRGALDRRGAQAGPVRHPAA